MIMTQTERRGTGERRQRRHRICQQTKLRLSHYHHYHHHRPRKEKKQKKQGKEWKNAQKKADDESNRRHKSDDQAQKQRAVDRFVPVEQEQCREQEQPVAAVNQAEERGVLEKGGYDMVDSALNVPTNSYIAELLRNFEGTLHHIAEMHYQLQARLDSIVASQNRVHAKVDFFVWREKQPI
jgi:hypothetical protein